MTNLNVQVPAQGSRIVAGGSEVILFGQPPEVLKGLMAKEITGFETLVLTDVREKDGSLLNNLEFPIYFFLFVANDIDPEWRRRPRPAGCYISATLIPGNFLAEGTMFVSAGVNVVEPTECIFFERDAVAFQVIDSVDGDSARGEWGGRMGGVVRPLLKWTTQYSQNK